MQDENLPENRPHTAKNEPMQDDIIYNDAAKQVFEREFEAMGRKISRIYNDNSYLVQMKAGLEETNTSLNKKLSVEKKRCIQLEKDKAQISGDVRRLSNKFKCLEDREKVLEAENKDLNGRITKLEAQNKD